MGGRSEWKRTHGKGLWLHQVFGEEGDALDFPVKSKSLEWSLRRVKESIVQLNIIYYSCLIADWIFIRCFFDYCNIFTHYQRMFKKIFIGALISTAVLAQDPVAYPSYSETRRGIQRSSARCLTSTRPRWKLPAGRGYGQRSLCFQLKRRTRKAHHRVSASRFRN